MNQIEVLRRALGGIYMAILSALDPGAATYANETLLAFADDECTDPTTAEIYRGLIESVADAPSIAPPPPQCLLWVHKLDAAAAH